MTFDQFGDVPIMFVKKVTRPPIFFRGWAREVLEGI